MTAKPRTTRTRALLAGALAFACSLAVAPAADAANGPAWALVTTSAPTRFAPGQLAGSVPRNPYYEAIAYNVGGAASAGPVDPVTITERLPVGVVPSGNIARIVTGGSHELPACTKEEEPDTSWTVSCSDPYPILPGEFFQFTAPVNVTVTEPTVLTEEATISGGGAAAVTASTTTPIEQEQAPFGFPASGEGFATALTDEAGGPASRAGSHPYQLNIHLGFASVNQVNLAGKRLTVRPAAKVRDLAVDFPRGMIVNPQATPVRCTEAQLENRICPPASQVGSVGVTAPIASTVPLSGALYNMVPPPGQPAELGFEAGGIGLYVHIRGGVRSDGDYGLSGYSDDTYNGRPFFATQITLWGDPSDPAHDAARGDCAEAGASHYDRGFCPTVEPHDTAFLTMPSSCGGPITSHARTDSWEEPGVFHDAFSESADLGGTPVGVSGCNQLQFEPSIEARPTTNLADSPSGLDVDVHQPTDESVSGSSPAIARDISLKLPGGMTVNPSSADGLGACMQAEAKLNSLSPAECPDGSKLGSVEVSTPLEDHPLPGALYLAKPYENPFGSLLALYLAVDDPQSGVVANLAGEVEADPVTGQLTTTFLENPELPLEDVRVHMFTGPRAALRTPGSCGTYTTTADMVPWSTPETAEAHPSDSFAIGAAPGGGACPASAAQASNSPSFSAGTMAPQAGAFSPFVLKVKREDATQPIAGIDTTLPPGLTGKLAGIAECSETQIAQARARSNPNEGALELASPSCPSSSEVGQVDVAAGAGIAPLHVQGRAYLAGPYKGAPLSLAVITPAVAGPFDLGVVVVRVALHLDPATTQIHAVSDPFPQILYGIPLDLRSVSLQMGRPEFTLNPTSCDPMTISGSVTSALGGSAGVSAPFQVGGCSSLAFKPKLTLKLKGGTKRGGHPALKAILTMPPGGANIAGAVVALPRSEFIDQGHFRTICTRVQFAAHSCPARAIYGHVRATSPLVDYPVEGPVYLRSSDNQLPDLVFDLHGPPSQPIEVEAAARIDSIHGGIRSSFEAIPDLPISKVILEMEGGKKGLFQNSTNICAKVHRASAQFEGQNGKVSDLNPPLKPRCKKAHKRHRKHHRR